MTPGDDTAVYRALGELSAGVKSIQESQRRMEQEMQRSEDKSDESRAKLHKRMDELVARVAVVESDVKSVGDDVTGVKKLVTEDIKPTTDKVKRWELIGIGALSMAGVAGTALGVTFADTLRRFIALMLGRG